ncbi:MAG: Dyp-type peroxidase [Gemmatimonadales bacterium]|nr:Dyp-type peroxidase [Gemmatimonadales bacterium]
MQKRRQAVGSGGERPLLQRRPLNLPRRHEEQSEVEAADIQGNVLRGYSHPMAAYIFLRIDDVVKGKALIDRMLPRITTGQPWCDPAPTTAIQVAFTYAGLQRLGVPDEMLATFPEEFREGMAARAESLGDRGPSAPEQWESGLGTGEAHVLVTVWAVDNEHLDAVREELRQVGASAGATTVINETRAEALKHGRDHFGFFDGISQPAVEGTGVQGRPGDGQPNGAGGWRDVATGEFVLGYVDEDGTLPDAPAEPFHRNGTFMVYRKLQQHTAAFRRSMEEQGARYPGGAEMLAAKVVGRWRDGTPLSTSPEAPDADVSADPLRINDFSYMDDPKGLKCPMGSHIRRCHPRDSEGFFGGRLTNRHRIIRRGRSYGPVLPKGAADDGQDRGLVFVCFNTSIWRQFETIQSLWLDDGDPFGVGPDKDPLIGCPADESGKMTIPGKPPFFLTPLPRFVTLRGGEYLFQPSMAALRWLADF